MIRIILALLIATPAGAAYNYARVSQDYARGSYPHNLQTLPNRMYSGDCFRRRTPERRDWARLNVFRVNPQQPLMGQISGWELPNMGSYAIEAIDARTAQLFGAFPDRVEIRQTGLALVLRIYDGFDPHKIYCWLN